MIKSIFIERANVCIFSLVFLMAIYTISIKSAMIAGFFIDSLCDNVMTNGALFRRRLSCKVVTFHTVQIRCISMS